MIYYEPLPLLEANLFLANRAIGLSGPALFEKRLGGSPNKSLLAYSEILTKLEQRLNDSITTLEGSTQTLYSPLHQRGLDSYWPSSDYLANLLFPNLVDAFVGRSTEDFLDNLRRHANMLPLRIINSLNPHLADTEPDVSIQALFSRISDSDLSYYSKLTLTDLALNVEKYIDMLGPTLFPVAEAFQTCREFITPLLDLFRERYQDQTETAILDRLWPGDRKNVRTIHIFPSVVCSSNAIFAFNDDETVLLGCVGCLYELLHEYLDSGRRSVAQLSKTMGALSNQNRLQIIANLLNGPAYGRELASAVGISPVTISQHISVLLSANLVTAHSNGSKAYYSLNNEELCDFVNRLKEFLKIEDPQAV